MTDQKALKAVAESLRSPSQTPVLEIGPGLGFLTQRLLDRGYTVTAVEKDKNFSPYLSQKFAQSHLRLIEADILNLDPVRDAGLTTPYAVIGNIPYNITSPILEWLISRRADIAEAVLTVQYEVAQRWVSGPGSKLWGSSSVFIQTYADARLVQRISRGSFSPVPKVDSAIVRIQFLPTPRIKIIDEDLYFTCVRRAFQKRRKTLLNSLESEQLSKAHLAPILKSLGINPSRRAETLTLHEWASLSNNLVNS